MTTAILRRKRKERYKDKFFMVRASKVGKCNEHIYGESENKRQNVPSVIEKARLILLDKALELRSDMKSCKELYMKEEGRREPSQVVDG